MSTATATFELLRLTAAPVGGSAAVIELSAELGGRGRFARQPQLAVGEGEAALEIDAAYGSWSDGLWDGAFVLPAEAIDRRMSLVHRGVVIPLPLCDSLDDADRYGMLARNLNRLRRAVAAAQAKAAQAQADAAAAFERGRAEGGAELAAAKTEIERLLAANAADRTQAATRLDEMMEHASAHLGAERDRQRWQIADTGAETARLRRQICDLHAQARAEIGDLRRAIAQLQADGSAAIELHTTPSLIDRPLIDLLDSYEPETESGQGLSATESELGAEFAPQAATAQATIAPQAATVADVTTVPEEAIESDTIRVSRVSERAAPSAVEPEVATPIDIEPIGEPIGLRPYLVFALLLLAVTFGVLVLL